MNSQSLDFGTRGSQSRYPRSKSEQWGRVVHEVPSVLDPLLLERKTKSLEGESRLKRLLEGWGTYEVVVHVEPIPEVVKHFRLLQPYHVEKVRPLKSPIIGDPKDQIEPEQVLELPVEKTFLFFIFNTVLSVLVSILTSPGPSRGKEMICLSPTRVRLSRVVPYCFVTNSGRSHGKGT